MTFPLRYALSIALILLSIDSGVSHAVAAQWTVIPQTSSIHFSGTQMGQPLIGRFERFSGQIDFEPGAMPKGAIQIDIDITSLKTGADDRDLMALDDGWFMAKRIPKAVFAARTFRQISPDNYQADGLLTIKGVTIPVTLPFTLHVESSGQAEMTGQVSLDRLKFGLGTDQFGDEAIVSHNIKVELLVHAKRVP